MQLSNKWMFSEWMEKGMGNEWKFFFEKIIFNSRFEYLEDNKSLIAISQASGPVIHVCISFSQ